MIYFCLVQLPEFFSSVTGTLCTYSHPNSKCFKACFFWAFFPLPSPSSIADNFICQRKISFSGGKSMITDNPHFSPLLHSLHKTNISVASSYLLFRLAVSIYYACKSTNCPWNIYFLGRLISMGRWILVNHLKWGSPALTNALEGRGLS